MSLSFMATIRAKILAYIALKVTGKIVINDIERIKDENIFTLSEHIHDVIKPKDRRFKSAPFRAAYIMAIDLKLCDIETADSIYTQLSHMRMNEWSQMMINLFQGTLNFLLLYICLKVSAPWPLFPLITSIAVILGWLLHYKIAGRNKNEI